MKISTESGAVTFASGTLTRDLSRTSFLGELIGTAAAIIREVGSFATYRIHPESGVIAGARFREDTLELVTIVFEMVGDTDENWTRDRELERKAIHDKWLLAEIGPPPYRFSWGEIESLLDEKACVSEIVVGYGPRRVQNAWWQKGKSG